MKENWLIYGATGFTGRLVAEEALKRGHRPVLAGRSPDRLGAQAAALGLDSIAVDLNDQERLVSILQDFQVVFLAAGPFRVTSQPMLSACLKAQTHYLDITGEIPVLEASFAQNEQARAAGVMAVLGVGFDVVPTDCLANFVAGRLPDAASLEIAFAGVSQSSAGTIKSGLGESPLQIFIRQDGSLVTIPMGFGGKWIPFSDHERYAVPVPWGDLATAFHSTRIGNIIVYMAIPPQAAAFMRRFGFSIQGLLRFAGVRNVASRLVDLAVHGPQEEFRQTSRSHVWARARNSQGQTSEAWLETLEPYQFTAVAGVRTVEKVLAGPVKAGVYTPAEAFGPDFVLEIPGTVRVPA